MSLEFTAKHGLISKNNSVISGSLIVTNGVTASLYGSSSYSTTASYALNSGNVIITGSTLPITSSYALTASYYPSPSGSSQLYLQCNDGNTYQISLYKYNGNIFLDINQNPIIGNNGFINIGNVNVSDVTGMWSNPNGNIVPNNINNAATYYQDPAYSGTPTVWLWSVTNQAWFQLLG
jgi:hypothetical protein